MVMYQKNHQKRKCKEKPRDAKNPSGFDVGKRRSKFLESTNFLLNMYFILQVLATYCMLGGGGCIEKYVKPKLLVG